jgi:hypothetical protein
MCACVAEPAGTSANSSKAPAGDEVAPGSSGTWGFSPLSRRLVYHTLSLPHASQQVLGADLNRSESAEILAHSAATTATFAMKEARGELTERPRPPDSVIVGETASAHACGAVRSVCSYASRSGTAFMRLCPTRPLPPRAELPRSKRAEHILMRSEVWRDCRNVAGGAVTETSGHAEQFGLGPARMPDPEKGCTCHMKRAGERVEITIIKRRRRASPRAAHDFEAPPPPSPSRPARPLLARRAVRRRRNKAPARVLLARAFRHRGERLLHPGGRSSPRSIARSRARRKRKSIRSSCSREYGSASSPGSLALVLTPPA